MKPLESLTPLENVQLLRGFNIVECKNDKNNNLALDIIETALKDYEKEHTVLEIIIKKDVNVYWFRYCCKHHKEIETRPFRLSAFEAYNNGVKVERRLTQEEFNLLKEVLK